MSNTSTRPKAPAAMSASRAPITAGWPGTIDPSYEFPKALKVIIVRVSAIPGMV
jgi:hypothetical protein